MSHICIGGGGIKGFCILGVLDYLMKSKKVTKIKKFHGCSIGAIIGVLVIGGKQPNDLFKELLDLNFKQFWDIDINRILSKYSILGNAIFTYWKEYVDNLLGEDITIKMANERYNVDINIVSTCLDTQDIVIFNETDYPDVKITDALIASSTIPFIFEPYEINGKYYIDGSAKCLSGVIPSTITDDTIIIKIKDYFVEPSNISILEYTLLVLKTMAKEIDCAKNKYTLEIVTPIKYHNTINYNSITNTHKTEMYLLGLRQGESFYKSLLTNQVD